MIPDPELLERYATGRDEAAFAELVRRHVNHVYSTALRLVGGDAHLAEDAAQTVFADLARKASALRKCRALSGWLHTSTRFAAAKLVRSEQRRRQREQATLPMPPTSCEYDSAWDQSRAFLDEAIGELDETDRDALLLRYFEEKPFAELGARFGLSENAARMRVERALDRLRSRLALRGITSTAAALGSALAQFVVGTAPATLQDQIVGRVMAGSAATASTSSMLTMAKLALVAVGVLVAVILGVTLKRSSPSVTANDAPAPNSNSQAGAASPEVVPSRTKATPGRATSAARHVPELFFVDDQTGGAISNRAIKLKGWEKGFHSLVEKQVLLEDGRCVPPFEPAAGPDFRIYTEAEGYANVHLHWKLGSGEALPESYLVRLVRPALIGGRVVDPSGRPVSGATVGFNTENVAAEGASPEDHCVDYLTVKTGSDGRWRIHCLAPEMVARIFGCASHPDYSPSGPVQASRQPEVVQELTNGTLVLRLGEGIIVRGSVVDTSLQPIVNATVRVGQLHHSSSREAKTGSDGGFSIGGCPAGDGIVSAEANGFAPAAIYLKIAASVPPVQLTLGAGRALRLRVVDGAGETIRGAQLLLDSFPRSERLVPIPQIELRWTEDAEGRIVWSNAPDQELAFDALAPGYLRHSFAVQPSEEEQLLTLQRALTISGTVRDADTGELIPRFRLGIGWPRPTPGGSFEPQWSTIDRFWVSFRGGEFRHTLQESVSGGESNPAYVFRFEAEGHAPFVTRAFAAEEGEVQLEVSLRPVEDIVAIAYAADGKIAPNVQVGLMFPGTDARLVPGGFAGELGHAMAWVRRADGQGRFVVPGGEKIQTVVLAAPSGYAETTVDELRKIGAVRLRPWARVEGRFQSEGAPDANARLTLQRRADRFLMAEPDAFETMTGADGRFVFAQVPPGSFDVVAGDRKVGTAEARAGETSEVTLADADVSAAR
jgi:RNA polymerase sigma factor (sigma-70 family)